MLALASMVLLAVAPVPATGWHVVASTPFDPRQVTFYWEGSQVRSPATFTTDGREIKVNGVTVLPTIPSDTAGVNARIADAFAGVALMDSLVAQGMSYEEAADKYGCEMGRRLRRAVRPSLAVLRAGGSSQGTPQLNAIAEELRIPHEAVRVRAGTLECIIGGGVHLRLALDAPDSMLLADPGPRLVIGDQARTVSYTDAAAAKAIDQIHQAVEIYKRGGPDAVRRDCK